MTEAISGSHGFLGSTLGKEIKPFVPLGRNGYIPEGVKVVYDCAAYGNLKGQDAEKEIYKANLIRVIDSFTFLEDDAAFVYVSSSSVTREPTYYSTSKAAAEQYVKIKAKKGYNTAIVRPFSITGVGEQDIHLIPKLIDSCLRGTPMLFVEDPVHDFVDVRDVASALVMVAQHGQLQGEIYQVGSGVQHTNKEVKEMIEKITGNKANVTTVETMREYDSKEWRADTTAIRSLGWKPQYTLEQTLKEMVKDARENN